MQEFIINGIKKHPKLKYFNWVNLAKFASPKKGFSEFKLSS